ncbi:hypothetical protein ABZ941_30680 [Streptomyces rubiginosohelvolus]|uniref:hypothetical protein n=1 Tax=Streptomyces rubiginosohelvolus TaxID=67362 RepID=UPI0033E8830B
MARFAHTVTVAALDRGWFEEAADALVDLLDASREGPGGTVVLADGRAVEGLRLLKGRHLRPGARYGEVPAAREGAGKAGTGAEAADGPAALVSGTGDSPAVPRPSSCVPGGRRTPSRWRASSWRRACP